MIAALAIACVVEEAMDCGEGTHAEGTTCVADADTATGASGDSDTESDSDSDADADAGTPAARWTGDTRLPEGLALTGEGAGDCAGSAVLLGADLNGDGTSDVLAGANYAPTGGYRAGAAYVLHGPLTADRRLADADAVLLGDTDYQQSASRFANRGDADGDGDDEFAVAMPGNDTLPGGVCLMAGGAGSSGALADLGRCWTGEGASDSAGADISAGDLDGDGLRELVVGAPYNSDYADSAGAAYVIEGSSAGSGDLGGADVRLYGAEYVLQAGSAVNADGDLDGDGLADLAIGAPRLSSGGSSAGGVYVFLGMPAHGMLDSADALVQGHVTGGYVGGFPGNIAMGSDVDGDGRADLLVGATGYGDGTSSDTNRGAAYLVTGTDVAGTFDLNFAGATLEGEDPGDAAGQRVEAVGDIDGDGHGDFMVAAPSDGDVGTYAGLVYLVYGPVSGTAGLADVAEASFQGNAASWLAGFAIAGGHDATGDGVVDLAIGALGGTGDAAGAGAIYVLPGVP